LFSRQILFFILLVDIYLFMKKLNSKQEGTIEILAALLVLFSAMLDPKISLAISVVALAALGIWKFLEK